MICGRFILSIFLIFTAVIGQLIVSFGFVRRLVDAYFDVSD